MASYGVSEATGPQRRRRRMVALLAALALAAVFMLVALVEGDLREDFGELTRSVRALVGHYGAPASYLLLYIEESGIPLPVPGDIYLVYLSHITTGSLSRRLIAWAVAIVVVTAGASNLYLVSRRWGNQLVHGPLGRILHVDEKSLEAAEQNFRRWGALAIIFGRHIPGFRVPITLVAGSFRVPYLIFAVSVAVSTTIWAGVYLWFGDRILRFLTQLAHGNRALFLALVAAIAIIAGVLIVRTVRSRQRL